jgi:hypothetical protein
VSAVITRIVKNKNLNCFYLTYCSQTFFSDFSLECDVHQETRVRPSQLVSWRTIFTKMFLENAKARNFLCNELGFCSVFWFRQKSSKNSRANLRIFNILCLVWVVVNILRYQCWILKQSMGARNRVETNLLYYRPANVALRAVTTTLFLLVSQPHRIF